MNSANRTIVFLSVGTLVASAHVAQAQDWPQFRGPNRDAKAVGFTAPQTWPKELAQKWKVTVGDGVATPSLVGDKLYVFSRDSGGEILRCLDAGTGKELWQDKYDALGATGPASGFSGPRCSPTVADGKVVTLGVRGVLSCLDATTGKVLWRKDDFPGALPRFFTSASPIVADGLCVAEVGGNDKGGVVAYDLATGEQRWSWTGDSPAYASPVLMTASGVKLVIAETESKMLALTLSDGKMVWETPFAPQRMGYNAATPIVNGSTLIYTGSNRGTTAVQLEKEGETWSAKPLWKNADVSVQFSSPVLKDGLLYGLTARNEFFCVNAADGKTAWTAPSSSAAGGADNPPRAEGAAGGPPPDRGGPPPERNPENAGGPNAGPGGPDRGPGGFDRGPGGPAGFGGPGGGRGMRGGGGGGGGGRGGGYGSLVDAGSVIFALTPASQLVAFAPEAAAFKELARIKVADTPTHAYPVVSGKRLFIKDQNAVTLWTFE